MSPDRKHSSTGPFDTRLFLLLLLYKYIYIFFLAHMIKNNRKQLERECRQAHDRLAPLQTHMLFEQAAKNNTARRIYTRLQWAVIMHYNLKYMLTGSCRWGLFTGKNTSRHRSCNVDIQERSFQITQIGVQCFHLPPSFSYIKRTVGVRCPKTCEQ